MLLIEIIKRVNALIPAKLLLIGGGLKENDIKVLVEENNLVDKVLFLGEQKNVNEWLQAMDVFVLPSLYEGFGIVVLEAQAASLPCIVSQGVPEQVKCSDEVFFYNLDDIDMWVQKIVDFSKVSSERNRNRLVKNIYDICECSKELENIYLSI